jgi:hypothetical protein
MASPHQLDLISPADDVWSVTRLTTTVKRMVESEIPAIWVRGEGDGPIAGPRPKRGRAGHPGDAAHISLPRHNAA